MNKTINLQDDEVFKRAVKFDDSIEYSTPYNERNITAKTINDAHRAREVICDLVVQGKLDATDLRIISARDCSPMPSIREIARILKISEPMARRKMTHIKTIISRYLC